MVNVINFPLITIPVCVSDNFALTGVFNGDAVTLNNPATGTYNNKSVGTNKTVTVNGLALTGVKANNYSLTSTTAKANIGIITAAALAIKSAEVVTEVQTIKTVSVKAYPNPFTEKVKIEFRSTIDSRATLEIYNIAGARLEILFDKEIKGGELNEVNYLPHLVSSQVVIYHLTIGDKTQVGKLIFEEKR